MFGLPTKSVAHRRLAYASSARLLAQAQGSAARLHAKTNIIQGQAKHEPDHFHAFKLYTF
jgi:hypothetical protein